MSNQAEEVTKPAEDTLGGAGGTAMKAAAAAVAAGTAAVLARKALSSGGGESSGNGGKERSERKKSNGRSRDDGRSMAISSIAAGGLDAARDALTPALEEAAGAAGTFLAENGPDVLVDRIVPRFIDSFNEARAS